tara:strand:- start:608 stop:988 length:381 start_codon:yes stop_codon:yes gene_type:complete
MVVSGIVAFSNLLEHESYQGQSTGKFSIVLTLDESNATKLSSQGVKLRQYEDSNGVVSQQRKFASKFNVGMYSLDNDEFIGQPTRGSEVRVQYSLSGDEHPVHGMTPYLDKVRIIKLAESATDEDF